MVRLEAFSHCLARFAHDEDAATAVEYGVMMGTLALGMITVVATSGERIAAVFNFILQDFTSAVPEGSSGSSSGN